MAMRSLNSDIQTPAVMGRSQLAAYFLRAEYERQAGRGKSSIQPEHGEGLAKRKRMSS